MTTSDVSRIIDKLDDMTERLAVLETKLDTHATHDNRLNSLERSRAMLAGLVIFIGIELQLIALTMTYMNRN